MNVVDKLKEIRDRMTELLSVKGREGQRQRYNLRKEEAALTHGFGGKHRGSKVGHAKGAFGKCRGPFDDSPALRPAEMRDWVNGKSAGSPGVA